MASWRNALSALLPFRAEAGSGVEQRAVFVSSARIGPRQHILLMVDENGAEIGRTRLSGRGHDIAIDPERSRVVVFARRPGYFALVVDVPSCEPVATITPPAGHHFFGHGVFSTDGRLLYATENAFDGETSRGVIGVYDASGGFKRIGEFETHGVDAHEILLAPDGRTLVVANGGIETHPDFGRQKLNLAEMRPSIVKLDSTTGDLLGEAVLTPTLNRLSMRHMTFDSQGAVWFGCQWEGDRTARPPLIGRLTERGAELVDMPDTATALARNYIGSVVASRDGGTIAASSPVGGQIFLFDAASLRFRSHIALADGCGLAGTDNDTIVATSGDGRMVRIDDDAIAPVARRAEQFDNHLRRIESISERSGHRFA
ncbi:DUF1513 domain-containing protein [Kaistia dalseonensis]|uniref:DUF1513 domain-containing protein n=1 Tax=Kaistia dalseonensis TaxID=410840 RepID=A0ABU0H6A0_9HYPH|nr:DUF1513 domain-containing protein [Kaistia dalseonensis]MCX5495253.1 DUF1513 domain-containing protein [Kaistia dalseonensis]MDQ0437839.1 hypothetical protein [Kaistia dalseonensis]